jgi:multiple sugar transport system ATP-binding protein
MTTLRVEHASKDYGARPALRDISFEVGEGEFFTLVGPTNAGKSTLLKIIAGLVRPDRGRVLIKGVDVTGAEPRHRQVSLLFQNVALFPHQTGFDNIAFPLRTAGQPLATVRETVQRIAALLRVEHLLDRLPRTYSGGEQQRVALGRALARPGHLLMLDEPLSNLDARIRTALRVEFKALHRQSRQSILYVTHDQVEAMSLSDRIAVLNEGEIEQVGTANEIYHRPRTRFVASFIGTPPMNILAAEVVGDGPAMRLRAPELDVALPGGAAPLRAGRLGIGIRPEQVQVAAEPGPATPIRGNIHWVEDLGDQLVLDAQIGGQPLKALVESHHPVRRAGPAYFGLVPRPEHLLDLESGMFLPGTTISAQGDR